MTRRLASISVIASVIGFVALELPAMLLYPGGTWWDKDTVGYRFWENYLCDMEWHVALDGRDNTLGSHFAQAALLVLVAGLAPFWVVVPELFAERRRLGRAVQSLGLVAVAGSVAVAFMPSDRFGALHGAMVIASGVPGLTAASLAVSALLAWGPRPRVEGWIGGLMMAFSLANFVLYTIHWVSGAEATIHLPAIQKVSLALLLAWMTRVALRVMQLRPAEP